MYTIHCMSSKPNPPSLPPSLSVCLHIYISSPTYDQGSTVLQVHLPQDYYYQHPQMHHQILYEQEQEQEQEYVYGGGRE